MLPDIFTFKDDETGIQAEYRYLEELHFSGSRSINIYSSTYLIEDTDTKTPFVLKQAIIDQKNGLYANLQRARQVRNEISAVFQDYELSRILGITQKEEPHIIPTFSGQKICSIQNYIPGQHLSPQSLPDENILHAIDKTADLIARLVGAGVVHCDIKPENIITNNQDIALIDPDLINYTNQKRSKWITGTVEFISPEAIDGTIWEPTRDIYSLGVTALILGRFKFSQTFAHNLFDSPRYQKQFGEISQALRYSTLKYALLGGSNYSSVPKDVQRQLIHFASYAMAKADARPTTHEEMNQILFQEPNIEEI